MDFISFDFGGCGLSEDSNEKMQEEWRLSLGFYEKIDLGRVIEYIVESGRHELILWGRSMGAVTI